MDKMKYICFKSGGLPQIVIFTPLQSHRDMANQLGLTDEDIISAGFFTCDPDSVKTYGESISLQVESKATDADKIKRVINGY